MLLDPADYSVRQDMRTADLLLVTYAPYQERPAHFVCLLLIVPPIPTVLTMP
jgi:hypothetical protein